MEVAESHVELPHPWCPLEDASAELCFPVSPLHASPMTGFFRYHPHILLNSFQISRLNLDGWIMTFPSCSAH